MKSRFTLFAILLALLTSIQTNGQVVINEFMAQNTKTITDAEGQYEDWIELKNIGSTKVNITGMYLSDNPDNKLKWKVPDETEIEAGGYLLIWADEDGKATTGLHANFKLSASGEMVMLYDTDANKNKLLDSISFGAQTADKSFGRYPDGASIWQVFSHPTPGSKNDNSTDIVMNQGIPMKFSLEQNYPNPFNPETTISYSIPTGTNVKIVIYDATGCEVETLINEFKNAGTYKLKFLAAGIRNQNSSLKNVQLSSGIYFYKITAGDFSQVKKMILLR